jgi:hypothetical protein
MVDKPVSATIFAFNVGFGDCFLMRFQYQGDMRRHVLIDFGSTRKPKFGTDAKPKKTPGKFMVQVAKQIKELCGGKLDIVVATHRHKDHISGFSTNKSGTGPGDVIASCKPTLILQPWTEHPRAARNAKISPDQQEASMMFARELNDMSRFSSSVFQIAKADRKRGIFDSRTRKALSFLGENNIANKNAIKNLQAMGDERRYLAFGQDSHAGEILPGVNVDVLGPPTLEQSSKISKQKSHNEEEYWHLQAASLRSDLAAFREEKSAFPDHASDDIPQWARWGSGRLKNIKASMLMPIVRRLDRQMNNTSLILLFSVGDKSLLFPGDAQWENWSYALGKEEVCEKLKSVDVYKVGHHGSLNATPKSLWRLLENKGDKSDPDRLTSIMSTKHGVHGHSHDTSVPRETLVDELKKHSHYRDTEAHELHSSDDKYYDEINVEFG